MIQYVRKRFTAKETIGSRMACFHHRRHSAFRTIRGGTLLGLLRLGSQLRQLRSLGYQSSV